MTEYLKMIKLEQNICTDISKLFLIRDHQLPKIPKNFKFYQVCIFSVLILIAYFQTTYTHFRKYMNVQITRLGVSEIITIRPLTENTLS